MVATGIRLTELEQRLRMLSELAHRVARCSSGSQRRHEFARAILKDMNDNMLVAEHPGDFPKGGFVLVEEVLKLGRQKHVVRDINLLSFEKVTGRRNGLGKCLLRKVDCLPLPPMRSI